MAETNSKEFWLRKLKEFFNLPEVEEKISSPSLRRKKEKSVKNYFEEGSKLAYLEKYKEAIQCYSQAVKKDPRHYLAWIRMGNVYYHIQDYSNAEKCYKDAQKINSNILDVWFNLGVLYQKEKKYEEALDCYNKAVKIMDGYYDAWYNMALIYAEQGKKKECKESLSRAITLNPILIEEASTYSFLKEYV
ncbi:MAG: tetratricopeptide repeat protein [Proteobacteria bacterium]|nr:tetratricopeptide repeat protein [Pseudomonadota bacterium]